MNARPDPAPSHEKFGRNDPCWCAAARSPRSETARRSPPRDRLERGVIQSLDDEKPPRPSEAAFVIPTDSAGLDVRRRSGYDLWIAASDVLAPLIVLVHGPVREGPRPREWSVYQGYGSLLARSGFAVAVTDLDYTDVRLLSEPITQLAEATHAARSEPGVDGNRAVIWGFSGGARLVAGWIEEPPKWLRGVGLSYPVVPAVRRAPIPIVLTRVGLEDPAVQETVDRLVALATDIQVIDVSKGHHGFDALDQDDESRQAVRAGVAAVARLLS